MVLDSEVGPDDRKMFIARLSSELARVLAPAMWPNHVLVQPEHLANSQLKLEAQALRTLKKD